MKTLRALQLVAVALSAATQSLFAQLPADTVQLRPDYRNQIFESDPVPPPGTSLRQTAAIAIYSGDVGIPGKTNSPNDGVVWLSRSVIGQPVGGRPFLISGRDFYLGDEIVPEPELGVDRAKAPTSIDPAYGAAFVPGTNRVFGAHPGLVQIKWRLANGGESSPISYYIKEPVYPERQWVVAYHTHNSGGVFTNNTGRLTGVPEVQVPTSIQLKVHYNPSVVDSNVFALDPTGSGVIVAKAPIKGFVLLEYRDTQGAFLALEVVEVKASVPDGPAKRFDLGAELTPVLREPRLPWATPLVSRGTNALQEELAFVYQHANPQSSQNGRIWAIKSTTTGEDIEVYWRTIGRAGIIWPYELSRYTAGWPTETPAGYQKYVRGSGGILGPDVEIPATHNARLMPFQEPAGHANAVDANRFLTKATGWSLLQYRPGNDVAFQVVRSVLHNDRNIDGLVSTADAIIGNEITDLNHQGPRPGYIHVPEGDKYDWEAYEGERPEGEDLEVRRWTSAWDWKPEWTTRQIFAVNKGMLEVWWSRTNQAVQWPAYVKRYTSTWPGDAFPLIIASQKGSGTLNTNSMPNLRLYYQNDPARPGFNPNDEHAFPLEGTNGVSLFALRDDLKTDSTSEAFALLKYQEPTPKKQWRYQVFRVVAEEGEFTFNYEATAGVRIQPPHPIGYLNFLEYCPSNYGVSGPHWRDRKDQYWARAAGDDGGMADIVMRYHYSTNIDLIAGLYFPPSKQPTQAPHVRWLEYRAKPGGGVPVDITYKTAWPDAPTLQLGETLVKPKFSLPDIGYQKSVEIVYQQAAAQGLGESVKLIDPTAIREVDLAQPPDDVVLTRGGGNVYFADLPPQLRSRVWFNPTTHKLRFRGEFVEPVAGQYYLLLNVLSARESNTLANLSANNAFRTAVASLGRAASQVIEVPPNKTFDKPLALTAGLARNPGYVTVAFDNSTNLALNNPADPITLKVIRVDCEPYQGELKVVASENPFDEKLTLRHSGDFSGKAEQYEFRWQTAPPTDGGPPPSPPGTADVTPGWASYNNIDPKTGIGAADITIAGSSIYTLSDNYFICSYRPIASGGNCPVRWSDWTPPMLAEGWIKRVLAGINPFEQRFKDYAKTDVNTLVSMISQAGPRWSGAAPLNAEEANRYGLLEIYETVMRRGIELSIGGNPRIDYGPANDALLLVASRISDLYHLLGNEAYADASDPTIAYGTDDRQYGIEASSIHCFQNQVPSLLAEELALLRGRDDSQLPSIETTPLYNRLVWNFTRDKGEVAYANNYNLRDRNADGVIDEADAKIEYPQGHGDAWGHYLSSLSPYYRLLRDPHFTWVPRSETIIVGGVPTSVDYLDERKFAQAAASLAQAGGEIVSLGYREQYLEDPEFQWRGYPDSNTNRAWGVSDWSSRVGQRTLFDWVVANALLPSEYRGSYQITEGTLQEVQSRAGYRLTENGLTHGIPREASGISSNQLAQLRPLLGLFFDGRSGFLGALDTALGQQARLEFQGAILRVTQTQGLPEEVISTLDRLKGNQYPTLANLQEALRTRIGEEAFLAHFESGILPYLAVPSGDSPTGVKKIERSTVPALREIPSLFASIQDQLDKAEAGLNPLGLVKNAIPFDLDPAQVEPPARRTHFEQVYERAVVQMNNAIAVFNHAVNASQALRRQSDTLEDFRRTVLERENDYTNRLVEVFGYPYGDDIGPSGTYPTGYNGPDLYRYMLSDRSAITGELPTEISVVTIAVTNRFPTVTSDGTRTDGPSRVIHYEIDRNTLGFVKPNEWTKPRRAPGAIQRAHSQLLQAKGNLDLALVEYDNLLEQIDDQTELLEAQFNINSEEIAVLNDGVRRMETLDDRIKRSRTRQLVFRGASAKARSVSEALAEANPGVFGFIAGLASGVIGDFTSGPRSALRFIGLLAAEVLQVAADVESIAELDHAQAKEAAQAQQNIRLTILRQVIGTEQQLKQLEQLIRQENALRLTIYNQAESLQQAEGDYRTTLAQAERLLEEWLRFRQQTAARIHEFRYKDMAFRIFRNDAIQKYRAQFDAAATYVYLAAKAYDYETNLRPQDPAQPGSYFLNQIIRSRTIGVIDSGVPRIGAQGDSGLASPMAQMETSFRTLKSQLGINDPIPQSINFSLRQELLRIVPGLNSTVTWRETLGRFRVADLEQVDAFRQYCNFARGRGVPGIVIEFPTTINADLNFFLWPYGPSDNRFNDTAFAVRIKSVGVSFSNYRTTGAGGMGNTPYVYLVPVGEDIMRSPRRPGFPADDTNFTRTWSVLDQVLPTAFRLSDKNDPNLGVPGWIPINSITGGSPLADIRKQVSFRAFHDGGGLREDDPQFRFTRLFGRSVWNTRWLLVIPGDGLSSNYEEGLNRFVAGGLNPSGGRDGNGVTDIKLRIDAYAYSGR